MNTGFDLKKFLRDSSYNIGRQIIAILLGMVTSALMARGLGTELQGLYSVTLLLPLTLNSFTNFGVISSTIYYAAHRDYDEQTTLYGTIHLSLLLGILSFVAGLLLGNLFGPGLFPGATPQFLLIGALITPALLIKNNLSAIFQGSQDFKTFNLSEIIAQVAMLFFVILFVWVMQLGVTGGLLAYLCSIFASGGTMVFFLFKQNHLGGIFTTPPNFHFMRLSIVFGLKTYLSDVISFLNLRSDKYLLNILAGASVLGVYDVAVQVSEKLWMVSKAIGTVLFPRIASMEQDEKNRVWLTLFMVRNVFWSSVLTALIVLPFLNIGIRFLYGESFAAAAQGIMLLLPGIVSLSVSRLLSLDMSGRGKPHINIYAALLSFIVNFISNLILIPKLGLLGASISSSISYTVTFIFRSILFCRETGSSWQQMILLNRQDLEMWRKLVRVFTSKAKNFSHTS